MTDDQFYKKAWEISGEEHYCEECLLNGIETYLINFSRYFISHILGKGAHPVLRHHLKNFNLLCADCHNKYEHGKRSEMKIAIKNEPVIEQLLEYERTHSKTYTKHRTAT